MTGKPDPGNQQLSYGRYRRLMAILFATAFLAYLLTRLLAPGLPAPEQQAALSAAGAAFALCCLLFGCGVLARYRGRSVLWAPLWPVVFLLPWKPPLPYGLYVGERAVPAMMVWIFLACSVLWIGISGGSQVASGDTTLAVLHVVAPFVAFLVCWAVARGLGTRRPHPSKGSPQP